MAKVSQMGAIEKLGVAITATEKAQNMVMGNLGKLKGRQEQDAVASFEKLMGHKHSCIRSGAS